MIIRRKSNNHRSFYFSSFDLLFIRLPKAFGYEENVSIQLASDVKTANYCFDSIMDNLKQDLIAATKYLFMLPKKS